MRTDKKLIGLMTLVSMVGISNVGSLKAGDQSTNTSAPVMTGNDSGMGQDVKTDTTRSKAKAHKRFTKRKATPAERAAMEKEKTDNKAVSGNELDANSPKNGRQ